MEIGLFQLENLATTPSSFVFFDLRLKPDQPVHPEIDPLLRRAERVPSAGVLARLAELGLPKSIPIVLLCEDGRASGALRSSLEAEGFDQTYVVESGVAGLLREINL